MLTGEGYATTDDGVRLFFKTVGNGAQTVLIPNAIFLFADFQELADAGRTLIFYDLRNRGRSDHLSDSSKLARGIHHDVEDLEAVRHHFGVSEVSLIGHSALGLMAILYALRYPERVNRIVNIGSMQPDPGKHYPPHLTNADATLVEVCGKLAQLQIESQSHDPDFGRKWWALMRTLFVADPADAGKVRSASGDLPKERIVSGMKHWSDNVLPSILNLKLTADEIGKVKTPVLTIHGTKDRQAPYGGGREWAMMLPNARLVTVENAAHVPWIEAPEKVFESMRTFLDGAWPEAAEKVESVV